MAKIRTLKPGFFRSRSLAKCPIEARLTFQGLWTEADDHGRGIADPRLLKGAIWPLDDDITVQHVSAHLNVLAATSHIRLYAVADETYYEVVNWESHQSAAFRRGEAQFPDISAGQELSRLSMQEDAASNVDVASLGREGKGREKSKPLVKDAAVAAFDREFEEDFWPNYPRKVSKTAAAKAFRAARKTTDLKVILDGLASYTKSVKGKSADFVAHAATWLNGRRWEDESERPDDEGSGWWNN